MIPVVIYASLDGKPPKPLGERVLTSKQTAIRETAELLRRIADAFDEQATFEEIMEWLL